MKRSERVFQWLRLLVVCGVIGPLITFGGVPAATAEFLGVEITGDCGPDNSNDDTDEDGIPGPDYPLQNAASEGDDAVPFEETGPRLDITLDGDAHRTTSSEGKYGRAITLDGTGVPIDAIKVANAYSSFNTPDLYAWWQLDARNTGTFWTEACRFEVGLDGNAQVYVKVFTPDCGGSTTYTSPLTWPTDGAWHHLLIHRYYDTQQRFLLRIDFSSATTQILATADLPSPSTQPPEVYFGRGIVGRVDELQAADYAPGPEANFDYDPANCGKNIPPGWCLEDVATASGPFSQTFLTWPLPARYKIVYNPDACTSGNKCKLVFALSGGGPCADNYLEVGDFYLNMIVEHVPPPGRSSLAVVTVDPICWAWGFEPYPDEILQFLAVKAHIASFHNDFFDVSGDYFATGCSHGAIQVIKWAADAPPAEFVSDHPKRTFVRSAGGTTGAHPDCEYHETWCGEKQELFDFAHFGLGVGDVQGCNEFERPWPHGHIPPADPCMDNYIDLLPKFIDLVNPPLVTAREIGRSWGVNLPIGDDNCGTGSPSEILCPEEGGFAATDGGRQFRQQWMAVEDPLNRTGYFIENDEVDCGHCKLSADQLECVVKYLEGGRVRLEGELGQPCLAWEQPSEPAKSCTGYPR